MCSVGPERETEGEGAESAEDGGNDDECFMRPSGGEGVENAARSGRQSVAAR
jgi:hypothetical protein